eukprot:Sdes_comp10157_c0_seq1m1773
MDFLSNESATKNQPINAAQEKIRLKIYTKKKKIGTRCKKNKGFQWTLKNREKRKLLKKAAKFPVFFIRTNLVLQFICQRNRYRSATTVLLGFELLGLSGDEIWKRFHQGFNERRRFD